MKRALFLALSYLGTKFQQFPVVLLASLVAGLAIQVEATAQLNGDSTSGNFPAHDSTSGNSPLGNSPPHNFTSSNLNSRNSNSHELTSHNSNSHESDSHDSNSLDSNSQNSGSHNSNSHNSNSHDSNSHNSNSHNSNSHNSNSHNSNSHNSNSHDSNSHDSNSHDSNSHNSNSHNSGSHNSNSHNSNSHDSNSHNSDSHNPNSHNPNSHNSDSHNPNSHNSDSHDSNSHDSNSHNSNSHNPNSHNPNSHNSNSHNSNSHNPNSHNPASRSLLKRINHVLEDDGIKDISFAQFRDNTLNAIKLHDRNTLVELLSENIVTAIGEETGKVSFLKAWEDLSPSSKFWQRFERVLLHGAQFDSESNEFHAPAVSFDDNHSDLPQGIAWNKLTELHADKASVKSLGNIFDDQISITNPSETLPVETEWLEIRTSKGSKGFAKSSDIYSAYDEFAVFKKLQGKWMLTWFGFAGL